MDLPQGIVLIECFPEWAGRTVDQVIRIADEGGYDNTPFHRVIDKFMAQGGATGRNYPALPPEFNTHPHIEGVCSMARTNDVNSASDQFFICFNTCSWLDLQYTVWGKVIYGMDNVHQIVRGEPPANPTRIIRMRSVDPNTIGL